MNELNDLGANNVHSCRNISKFSFAVGEKWETLIVISATSGSKRFTELMGMIDGISRGALALSLKSLERDGIIERTLRSNLHHHPKYELTALGRSLSERLIVLRNWKHTHRGAIDSARASFDARHHAERAT